MWINLLVSGYKVELCCGINQTINFFQNNYCQRQRIPYNAPPLTDTTLINIVRSGRESDNKCLTLWVNSVIYAARLNENVIFCVSLLFNN
ncbi:hypothetical protein CKY01_19460 [Photorhabdus laumondii subsp. clarkei]|uniref:Uncharacterized protein n=1 Tax=Photorhabdus laumondii subsp. clarkei TaxID=2029685 RepID=A0A329VBU3_9GAMM|nr:hypothetical protein CKY01_19460 [Photorhabdus laumondii subsp. clarkei]